jgi:hypothetical protein
MMIMNDNSKHMCRESIVSYSVLLFRPISGVPEKSHENRQSREMVPSLF